MDAVHGADQLHTLKVGAVQLRRHGLKLAAEEHTHDGGFDHIVEVVPQRDFVAAQGLCLAVQMAAPHPGAQITGVLFAAVGDLKHVRLKNGDGNVQKPGVALDLLAVDLVVAGVHHQKFQLKGEITVPLQFLHEFGHEHGVLAAGDAHGDAVALLNQVVVLDGVDEGAPQLFAVLFDDAALGFLVRFKNTFFAHAFPSVS